MTGILAEPYPGPRNSAALQSRAQEMLKRPVDISLHLPSLSIEAFRGIRELVIPRLGRVTLLAGKNGAGKTTVLDAVRVHASRGDHGVLSEILRERDELSDAVDEEREGRLTPNWEALFYGRDVSLSPAIAIGPADGTERLDVEAVSLDDEKDEYVAWVKENAPQLMGIGDARILKTSYNGKGHFVLGLTSCAEIPDPFRVI